MKIIKQIFFKD